MTVNVTDLLFSVTVLVGLLLDLPAAWILTRSAIRKPHITALSLLAFFADSIGLVVIVTITVIGNAQAGYPIAKEVAATGFRLALLILALVPPTFLLAYRRGWFRDAGHP
jgi:hypothetical protein